MEVNNSLFVLNPCINYTTELTTLWYIKALRTKPQLQQEKTAEWRNIGRMGKPSPSSYEPLLRSKSQPSLHISSRPSISLLSVSEREGRR